MYFDIKNGNKKCATQQIYKQHAYKLPRLSIRNSQKADVKTLTWQRQKNFSSDYKMVVCASV